jgi:hypothetical protein
MGTTDTYAYLSLVLSVVSVMLALFYAWRAAKAYGHHHDDRAAVGLGKAIGLLVVSIGLTLSATGLVAGDASWATAGLSVARGALLVLMGTLVLAGVRPGNE